jgi:hypothetical protein
VITASDNGAITFQWYSTIGLHANASYLPSWWDGTAKYDAPEPIDPTHVPYTGAHENCVITQRDLIFHSFALTEGGFLLPHLKEACSLHPLIWWKMRIHAEKPRAHQLPHAAPDLSNSSRSTSPSPDRDSRKRPHPDTNDDEERRRSSRARKPKLYTDHIQSY